MKNNYIHPKMNRLNLIIGGIFLIIALIMAIFSGCKKDKEEETPCFMEGGHPTSEVDKWVVPGEVFYSYIWYNDETGAAIDTTTGSMTVEVQSDLDFIRNEADGCNYYTNSPIPGGQYINKLKVCPIYGCFVPE